MNVIKSLSFVFGIIFFSQTTADVTSHFNQIKNDPNALYGFFKAMPKGGELHYHLAGGSSPETMLQLIDRDGYCLDKNNLSVSKVVGQCEGVKTKGLNNQPALYAAIVRDWSMKDFVAGSESGHDHFFKGFIKFAPIVFNYRAALLADIVNRAAAQKELYMEVLDIPDNANSLHFGSLLTNLKTNEAKRSLLLANQEFQSNVNHTVAETERMIAKAQQQLHCDTKPQEPACTVKVKVVYFVLREQPIDRVFAQALNAFEAVSRSKGNLVGVNLVQPEDGIISLRDYHKQMDVFNYMHALYPQVPFALHAGELSADSASFNDLSFHIHDAIFTGHAQRIGHGSDIAYEDHFEKTLNYMAKKQVPVEINLISNLKILNLSGSSHPLKMYLAYQVPVVFSTDDEGVLRTDLTRQYVAGVLDQGLDYNTLKQINRNALTYAFIKGKSIWADAKQSKRIPECEELASAACKQFINSNEKAQLQWQLEQQLLTFESQFK